MQTVRVEMPAERQLVIVMRTTVRQRTLHPLLAARGGIYIHFHLAVAEPPVFENCARAHGGVSRSAIISNLR